MSGWLGRAGSLIGVMLTAWLALPAAQGGEPDVDAEKVLYIYNWADYIDPKVIRDFERETGVRVRYEVMDSNELLETKLVAGRTGYDLVFPSASFLDRQIKAGLYRKLDKSRLPNLENLDRELTRKLARFDSGNEHSALYMWGTSGIAYNDEVMKTVMPNAPVDSFAMLYDPTVISKFAECGVSILDAPSEVIATVLIYLGKDPNSERPEDLAAAERVLMTIRPYIRDIHSSSYIEALASGEICLALGWSGDVSQARARAEEASKPFRIEYRIPREGGVVFFDSMAIPADAEHVKNAHLFINYLLRADVAAANSSFIRYASGNNAAFPLLPLDLATNRNIFPTLAMQKKLVADEPESAAYLREMLRVWTRFRVHD